MPTNINNNFSEILKQFQPISLQEIGHAQLMHRIDTKFVFHISKLSAVLLAAAENYKMVQICDTKEQIYETTYYDTLKHTMYRLHHNGKLNRHKIRIRSYIITKQQFLEIKFKNNKGETVKKRISRKKDETNVGLVDSFLTKNSPFNKSELQPSLHNKFIRLTLVHKTKPERITLDYNIWFKDEQSGKELQNNAICIAEVKRDRTSPHSDFINILTQNRIAPMGFSKYCMGLAMLTKTLKTNLFRERLRTIKKVAEGNK